ncbi:MAG: DPP IV N-terminal domain-containing protein [Bacteroidota bacterium]|nr:DPP IV N-terminal domain-containing protein [Bacteroidota bacterium]
MKSLLLILVISLFSQNIFSQEQQTIKVERKKLITVEDVWLKYTFYPKSIKGLRSLNDGINFTRLEKGNIVKYSYKTGEKVETIVEAKDLKMNKDSEPIRMSSYQFSNDEQKILIFTNKEPIYRHSFRAKNYIWDINKKELISVSDEKQQLASFNPAATKLSYMRNNNIFIFDIKTQKEKQITDDGAKNIIINGAPDWVYEEEFSFARGLYWSPDGEKIAFYKFDENNVKQWTMKFYGDLYPELYKFKYPKAGEDNSIVSIHVYDLKSNTTKTMDVGKETDQYIPRIKWTHNSDELCITRLNRLQNKLELLIADVNSGKSKVIFTEENKYYIEITDNLTFLDDNSFIWTSEKDGYNHIYLYDMKGKLVKQLTKGNWDVSSLKGVNEEKKIVYYISSESSPTQRDLYSINLKGKKKKKLSSKSGINDAHFSKTFAFYINYHSDANTPNYISLHNYKGQEIRVLEDNSKLKEKMADYRVSKKEFFTFKTSEGVELNAWMMKPYNFSPDREYPVFFTIYAGPNSNTVNDAWDYNSLWHQIIAQKGYIVVSVDPRGTGNRGEEFRKVTYQQLGKYETIDMIEAAKYLGSLDYVDKDRIGVQGWSYGGYMSSLCLFKGADYFKMAIAVAPVTNWRYYDNIYTERYMRTPQENPDGYDDNSPINFVEKLEGNYLLIHGGGDDNVHLQNTMMLAKALNDEGKQFDMHIYPNKNHGIYGGKTRYQLFTKMTNFILENL